MDLSEDALDLLERCIFDDFTSSDTTAFHKIHFPNDNRVILIDVLSKDKFTLTEMSRNRNWNIVSKTYEFNRSFVKDIVYLMKKYYHNVKCDIYFFHYINNTIGTLDRTLRSQYICETYFGAIQKNLTCLGYKLTLLPNSLKTVLKEKSKPFEYLYIIEVADYIVPFYNVEKSENIEELNEIIEKHMEK